MNSIQAPSGTIQSASLATASAPVVEVGTLGFFEQCLHSMSRAPAIGILGSPETLNAQPLWLEAGIGAQLFQLTDRTRTGERDFLVKGEQQAISKVVRAITDLRPKNGEELDIIVRDPITGDPLSEGMQPGCPLQLSVGLRSAFSKLVTHVVEQLPSKHETTFTGLKKGSDRKVPIDQITLNLGILLLACTYIGDLESAQRLMEKCPSSALAPVCDFRLSSIAPFPAITPIGSAFRENRADFLALFQGHGVDILQSPAFWMNNDSKFKLPDPTSTKALDAASTVLGKMLNSGDMQHTWPSTAEFLLQEAKRRASVGDLKESVIVSHVAQGLSNFDPGQVAVFLRSEVIADHASALVEETIEALKVRWAKNPMGDRTLELQVLDQLMDNINLDRHLGTEFPVDIAIKDGNLSHKPLAMEIARRYGECSRADLLIEPHNKGLSNQSDGSFAHIWAGDGETELVLYCLGIGANLKELDSGGRTMIEHAEAGGHEDTSSAIRAYAARTEAQAAIASLDREFLGAP